MAGYLLVPHGKVDAKYNAGFSMYVAAWPLLKNYPGQEFQSGLFGTWMFAQYDGPKPEKMYSDIEGGLGWWRDTRFATETPKFIMGGVALNFSEWANGPGAGKGRDWKKPAGHYAIAQLSPWVLWPPDGLNLKQGTCGRAVRVRLPAAAAHRRPRRRPPGKDVPTGNQCWTLFLNTGNFKGPVTFFLPYFWSQADRREARSWAGCSSTPGRPSRTRRCRWRPSTSPRTSPRTRRATPTPASPRRSSRRRPDGDAPLIHRITAYSKAALWDGVQAWFDGGKAASGAIDPKAAGRPHLQGQGRGDVADLPAEHRRGTRRCRSPGVRSPRPSRSTTPPTATSGRRTCRSTKDGSLVTLPEYYRLEKDKKDKERWVVVSAKDVPAETGLAKVEFPKRRGADRQPYVTPDEADSCWKKPGPAAGPFEAKLGDGSVVTYYWYRFADQPALLNADLTAAEREALQKRVEMLHKNWTKDREYLPPPTVGKLADLDPAVLVTPPKGLEVGYVPIVTRQAAKE